MIHMPVGGVEMGDLMAKKPMQFTEASTDIEGVRDGRRSDRSFEKYSQISEIEMTPTEANYSEEQQLSYTKRSFKQAQAHPVQLPPLGYHGPPAIVVDGATEDTRRTASISTNKDSLTDKSRRNSEQEPSFITKLFGCCMMKKSGKEKQEFGYANDGRIFSAPRRPNA